MRPLAAVALWLAASAAVAQPAARPIGRGWTAVPSPVSQPLAPACSTTTAFLVQGDARGPEADVIAWRGPGLVRELPPAPAGALAIRANPAGAVAVRLSEGVARLEGTQWRELAAPAGYRVGDLWVSARGRAVAVAEGRILVEPTSPEPVSTLVSYDAGTWRRLAGVWGWGDEVYTVGEAGLVMRHDGTRWHHAFVDGNPAFEGLWGRAPDDRWAWDRASLYRFDGTAWSQVPGPDPSYPWEVANVGGSDAVVLAAGRFGIARWDGTAWQPEVDREALPNGARGVCATRTHAVATTFDGELLYRALP